MANFTGGLQQVDGAEGTFNVPAGPRSSITLSRGFLGSGSGSGSPPSVTFLSPTPGQPLPSRGSSVIVEVVDFDGLQALVVTAEFASGAYEVVHDGDNFADRYAAGSTRVTIAGGYRFTVRRGGGWFDDVTIHVLAVDPRGGLA